MGKKLLVAMVRPEIMGEEAVQYVVAKYDYVAQDDKELSIRKNEKCVLVDGTKKWWKVQNSRGEAGYVPSNFMQHVKPSIWSSLRNTLGRRRGDKTRAQLQQQAQRNGSSGGAGDSDNDGYQSESQLCSTEQSPAVAKYAYLAQRNDEISLAKGEHVMVIEKSSDGWWKGRKNNEIGWFPSNYVLEEFEYQTDANTYANPATSDDQRLVEPGYQSSTTNTGGGSGGKSGENSSGGSGAKPPHLTALNPTNPTPNNPNTTITPCQQPHPVVMDTVKADYAYTSLTDEELSFNRDEVLDILDKSTVDESWWRARNRRGHVGLIPRNYVTTLSKDSGLPPTPESHSDSSLCTQGGASSNSRTPSGGVSGSVRAQYNITGPFAKEDWYFGTITRADAEQMLNKYALNGDFLVRASETNVGDYSITLKASKKNKHFRICWQGETGVFTIGQQSFDSLHDLVQHYTRHPIYRHDTEKLYLVKSFVHPSDVPGGHPLPDLPESPRTSDEATPPVTSHIT